MKLVNDILAFEDFNASSRDQKINAVKKVIQHGNPKSAFFIGRLEDIENNFDFWTRKCPHITPYFDVSCNDSSLVLQTLARLGAKFCFRNRMELEQLLKCGFHGENLFFRASQKVASHMRYASSQEVNLISFETKDELVKIGQNSPNCKALFLTRCFTNVETFTAGYLENLMNVALAQGVEIVGLALDSTFSDQIPVERAVTNVKTFFEAAKKVGHRISIIDIGELCPTNGNLEDFEKKAEVAQTLIDLINKTVPELQDSLKVFANPSDFIVKSAFCLAVQVLESEESSLDGKQTYTINEGVHGAFQRLLEHDDILTPEIISHSNHSIVQNSAVTDIVGPTKNFLDQICSDLMFPKCEIGDWILFDNVGNYNMSDLNTINIAVGPNEVSISGEDGLWFLSRDDNLAFPEEELLAIDDVEFCDTKDDEDPEFDEDEDSSSSVFIR